MVANKSSLKGVLLSNWVSWDGNGISDIPAKEVTLKDGTKASILVNGEGIGLYKATVKEMYTVEHGEVFIQWIDKYDEKDKLTPHLSNADIEEAFIVYQKYLEL